MKEPPLDSDEHERGGGPRGFIHSVPYTPISWSIRLTKSLHLKSQTRSSRVRDFLLSHREDPSILMEGWMTHSKWWNVQCCMHLRFPPRSVDPRPQCQVQITQPILSIDFHGSWAIFLQYVCTLWLHTWPRRLRCSATCIMTANRILRRSAPFLNLLNRSMSKYSKRKGGESIEAVQNFQYLIGL